MGSPRIGHHIRWRIRGSIRRTIPRSGWLGASLLLLLLSAAPTTSGAAAPSPSATATLLVGAASSLTEPLQALAPSFARDRGVPPPTFSFGSSGTLQQQIERGAPLDVLVAAGEKAIDRLEQRGRLLPGTRRVIAGNRLVLVVSARSPRRSLRFQDLAGPGIRRIAIGDSGVPAGDYARQTLAHFRLSQAVQDRLVPLASVRAVARAVAAGHVDAGIVYRSDAANVGHLRITATAPETSHAPITYSAAVIRSSRLSDQARAYVRFLTSPAAASELRRHGLLLARTGGTAGTAAGSRR